MKLSPNLKIVAIIILLIIFFVIVNLTGFSDNIKNFFYLVSAPIQKTFWGVGDRVSDFFEAISESKNLKTENEYLEFKAQELSAEVAKLRELKKENKILREALDIGLQKEFEMVFAQITGKDIAQDFILINKGTEDGILKDMPVIIQQRILVGKISQVYRNFSRVMLVSNKESTFPVNIQVDVEVENVNAIIRGRGGLQSFIDLIPLAAEIKKGDRIVTTALEETFPKGILIGYIGEVEKLGIEPFQRAKIQSVFNLKELESVFIIINN